MKVEYNLDKIIIYLFDKNKYIGDIKSILISVFTDLEKYYGINFNGSYNLNLYINNSYGMILEIKQNDYYSEYEIVNLKLNILNDTLFLYKVSDPIDYLNYEMYYYEDNFYINVTDIENDIYEQTEVIYDNEVYKILGKGIKLSKI